MKFKPNILFFIPVWKRLPITALCYKGLDRLIAYAGDRANIKVLIVASEWPHIHMADKHGYYHTMVDNEPLGQKFNKGMLEALEHKDWQYVWQINSDTLLDNRLFDVFHMHMRGGGSFGSIESLYLYDTIGKRAKEFSYTLNGCGIRVISREWVEKTGWQYKCAITQDRQGAWLSYRKGQRLYLPQRMALKPWVRQLSEQKEFRLWDPELSRGLDNNSRNKLFAFNGEPVGWLRYTQEPYVVDMKSNTNIWAYDSLQGDTVGKAKLRRILTRFPELKEAWKL